MLQRTMKLVLTTTIAVVSVVAVGWRVAAAEDDATGLHVVKDKSTISILDGKRPVLRYRYADVPKKPYVDQLYSPKGVQVLRDAPSDHLHHHGLMYALKIDGVGFWEESKPEFGSQETTQSRIRGSGFVATVAWLNPDRERLLTEYRWINVKSEPGVTLVNWSLALKPVKSSVTISGAHYYGLGLRFVESMDRGGKFIYADDKTPVPFKHQDGHQVKDEWLTPVRWCAYTAKAGGKPVTVAVFDNPENLRHPATMYTLAREFAYISATLNEQKEPITVEADQPLTLSYGVAVWDGETDKATIEKLYDRWTERRPVLEPR